MTTNKIHFITHELLPLLQPLTANAKGVWGVLNGQQMVEHLADAFKNASGKLVLPQVNFDERLSQFRGFLLSEKPFDPNIKNPFMSEAAAPTRQPDMAAALSKLEGAIQYFFSEFDANPGLTTINAFFGPLNFEENVQLLYKHCRHHLTQFELLPA